MKQGFYYVNEENKVQLMPPHLLFSNVESWAYCENEKQLNNFIQLALAENDEDISFQSD